MGSRICDHLRSNVVGYIAIFLFATGGTAIALDGSNTVFTDDIVNGEVTSPDVLDGSLGTADIRDQSIGSNKLKDHSVASVDVLNNSLSAADLAQASVGSSEVASNSLSAADLGTNSVGADEIAAGAVGSGEIAYQNPEWAQVDRNTIGSPVAALRAGPYSGPVHPPFGVGSLGLTVGRTPRRPHSATRSISSAMTCRHSAQVGFRVFTTPGEHLGGTTRHPQHAVDHVRDRPQRCGRDDDELLVAHLECRRPTPSRTLWSKYIDATSTGFWGLTGAQFNSPPTAANCGLERTPLLVRRSQGVPGDRDRGQDSHSRCRQGPGLRLVRCRRWSEDQRHRLRLRAARDGGKGSVRRRKKLRRQSAAGSRDLSAAPSCAAHTPQLRYAPPAPPPRARSRACRLS